MAALANTMNPSTPIGNAIGQANDIIYGANSQHMNRGVSVPPNTPLPGYTNPQQTLLLFNEQGLSPSPNLQVKQSSDTSMHDVIKDIY